MNPDDLSERLRNFAVRIGKVVTARENNVNTVAK